MGAYLDKPVTEKETETGFMELNGFKDLPFAVSSMQGWRKTMEDAHIALTNLESLYDVPEGTSLFAVFDGHGGKEVALFCAKHYVECLFDSDNFKRKAYREALIESFHTIDEMLMNKKFKEELMAMSGAHHNALSPQFEESDDEHEEESGDEIDPAYRLSNDSLYTEFGPNAKKVADTKNKEPGTNESKIPKLEEPFFGETKKSLEEKLQLPRAESTRFTASKEAFKKQLETEKLKEAQEAKSVSMESARQESLQDTSPTEASSTLVNEAAAEDSEDESTLSKAEALNIMFKMFGMNKYGPPSNEEEKPQENTQQPRFTQRFDLKLPTHAGATACVALIIEGKVYVANAGDSRAVLCRNKKALAMSYDHKPEQDIEKNRIEKAGGWVTPIGRVCGNLNLSRCIGDLKYKQNKNIPMADQIITAEPDVKVVDLQGDDLFLVVACDGVWDIMTNDAIVDFVSKSLVANAKNEQSHNHSSAISSTVEQVFNHCLCDDPMMDGKGGDNMTAIIACLKPMEDIVSTFWMY